MIKRVFDNDDSMYYCTLCNRPYEALREANEHGGFCGKTVPVQPTFEEDDDTQFYANEARTWQGLTDEEYQQILIQHDGAGLLAFYDLIETKLKEKNT